MLTYSVNMEHMKNAIIYIRAYCYISHKDQNQNISTVRKLQSLAKVQGCLL